jgi:hypothetical protein
MIATTIINSIRVKPFWIVFNIFKLSWMERLGNPRRDRLHRRQEQGLCQAPQVMAKLLFGRAVHCDVVDIVKWMEGDKNAALCH